MLPLGAPGSGIGSLGVGIDLTNVEFWSKRELSYEIKKYTEGVYILAEFTADTISTGDVQNKAKLIPEILRFLITQKQEEKKIKT
jgi:small subunit ribosomal protein S6